MIPIYLFTFLLGTIVGSFLGVVADRVSNNESIWRGRSHCDHCRHKLHWNDLIPLVSFLMLKRKCRYCHKELDWNYFIIELVTGLTYVLATYALFQNNVSMALELQYNFVLLYYFAITSALIAIAFTDIKYGIIPFKVVGVAATIVVFWYFLFPGLYITPLEAAGLGLQIDILNSLASGIGVALFFFALFMITKGRGLGFGDVVYAFLMGLVLGFPNVILALYLAFVTGAIVALLLILTKKKKFKGGTIPFGPFLVTGTIVSLFWGNQLITVARSFVGI